MTRLSLARHGRTDWNVEGRYQGQIDQPLNDEGKAQARELADTRDGRMFDAIFSSDLQRATVTAAIVAGKLGIPLHIDPRLREVNLGEWEGMLVSDIKVTYPKEWKALSRDPVNGRPPQGESIAEVSQRMEQVAAEIVDLWPEGHILVVSHGMALATLVARARGVPLKDAHSLFPANTAVIDIDWPPG